MSDIRIGPNGRAGVITLQRPEALNALTYEMCLEISAALTAWRDDHRIGVVVIDAEGDRAFCAGGDIVEMYRTGTAGDYSYGRNFWRDEYRMNAALGAYPKPVISFLQGFTMGGGVGLGCHGAVRIVGESSRIAMPECGIGLMPDVGGSHLLARAPGHLGELLGLTGTRMGPGDAIYAGFADSFVPEDQWEQLKDALCVTGTLAPMERLTTEAPASPLAAQQAEIDRVFSALNLEAIEMALADSTAAFAETALKGLHRGAPLSMACTLAQIRAHRDADGTLEDALRGEYRFTYRSMEHGDFIEGIRAQVIDKDNAPQWRHSGTPAPDEVAAMLAPLGADELTFPDPAAAAPQEETQA